jgi:hypothetical protein
MHDEAWCHRVNGLVYVQPGSWHAMKQEAHTCIHLKVCAPNTILG